jgi:hypothetical protein
VKELGDFCSERELARLMRSTQERHEQYVRVEIPRLLDEAAIDPRVRAKLESELRGLVRRYTNAVFRDIRQLLRDDEETP